MKVAGSVSVGIAVIISSPIMYALSVHILLLYKKFTFAIDQKNLATNTQKDQIGECSPYFFFLKKVNAHPRLSYYRKNISESKYRFRRLQVTVPDATMTSPAHLN